MTLVMEYRAARRHEEVARLRRAIALRAMVAAGASQREVAQELGVSQPAISQQLASAPDLRAIHPSVLLEAAAPVLKAVFAGRGYERPAVFGSLARGDASQGSDIDLLVQPPDGTSSIQFVELKQLVEQILDREIDLVSWAGLKPGVDDDIRREAVML